MRKKISIITPVYNAGDRLLKSINSVLSQTYTNFELILVNDGSTDNSLDICYEYANKDSRIKVYSQANSGPAAARNLALDNAKGDYVTFLDSDDWVVPSAYEEMIREAVKTSSHVVECGYLREVNGEIKPGKGHSSRDELLVGNKAKEYAYDFIFSSFKKRGRSYVWLRLIDRRIIEKNHIRFNDKVRRSEDYLFLSILLMRAHRIRLITNRKLYVYMYNRKSITNNYVNGYWEMVLNIYNDLSSDAKTLKDDVYFRRIQYAFIYRAQMALVNESYARDGILKRKERIKQIMNHPQIRSIISKIPSKKGIEVFGKSFIFIKYKLVLIAILLMEKR